MATAERLSAATPPFVLTLELDGRSFAVLNGLRRRFYPPERNLVPAHVTLFHQLPGDRGRDIKAFLAQTAATQKQIAMPPGEAREIGRGVAVFLRSPQLSALRGELAREWLPWLTDQDRGGFRPHVTVQSGVGATESRQALPIVAMETRACPIAGVGLHLWRYLGGPWEDVRLFRFR